MSLEERPRVKTALRHVRTLRIDYWNEGTLRNTAILRTTVLVAGKNGYGILIKGSTAAFSESGP